ncbi:MAG: hypothetical protein ONB46_26160 [candidate division KSB1 bacterium]|nr:hypothetical protein [candidate division KSB1 bacterium]MDZ7369416.1 hypothetical protein [candidate division KSB1 bacterium]MDZ7407507.1 hypothetical protein [candidate division KSB1 bacterium]
MIQAQARNKLNQDDLQFIVTALRRQGEKDSTILQLLADAEMRDAMLDHPRLLEYLLEVRQTTSISPFLYFYVLVRHALREFKIDDRAVSDYVASLLAEFGQGNRMHRIDRKAANEYKYLVDLMAELLDANSEQTFYVQSHLGNYALFMTGIFPDHVYHRAKYHPPSPDFSYYEQVGSVNFQRASQHRIAEKYCLADILDLLGQQFRQVRLALNHLTDSFLHLDRHAGATDRVMRRLDNFREKRELDLE